MRLICPECKNEVNLSNYPNFDIGSIVECETCGITLEILETGEDVKAEVVDEGK
ncbi:MAG: lysine biosynthesis protein LysW [bacterium]|nr:lysine biosynthesis protein LysW [bacterium]